MQCPFGIWLGLSKDGQQLCVTKMIDQHNHETEKVTFENLPKRRKLSDPQEKQVKRLLELHGNKWLIHEQIFKETGKFDKSKYKAHMAKHNG